MRRLTFFTLMVLGASPGAAEACTVPVFRYALENWAAAPFEILVFHEGPLTAEQSALVKRIESAPSANVKTHLHDLDKKMPAPVQGAWEKFGTGQRTPCLMVRYPGGARPAPALILPLTNDNLERLLTSPARQELIRRLVRGDSAVWIVLGKGKAAAETAAMLEGELARLQKDIVLPPDDPDFPLRSNVPLHLRFSVLRVDRDDPEEAFFTRLLLGTADGLDKIDGPIGFPIFGRARILVGLHGKQLTAANVERWASFLCGPCSCRVKELNPGIDLLTSADWNDLLDIAETAPQDKALPPVAIPEGQSAEATNRRPAVLPPSGSLGWLWLVLGGGPLVGLVSVLRLLFQRRPPVEAGNDQDSPSTASTTQQPR